MAGMEKQTEGVALVSTRHSAPAIDFVPEAELRPQVVDLKDRLLWWRREPAFDALLHSGH